MKNPINLNFKWNVDVISVKENISTFSVAV